MSRRWFSPATGTWHDDLIDASHAIAVKTGRPRCYAHPINGDPACPECIAELEYLKKKRDDEVR